MNTGNSKYPLSPVFFVNAFYIFASVNDNFVVRYLGENALKYSLFFVALANSLKVVEFIRVSKMKNQSIWMFLLLSTLSLVANWPRIDKPDVSINLLLAVFIIYLVFSLDRNPRRYISVYSFSVLFSSLLCIFTNSTIGEYTFRRTGGTGDPNEFAFTVLISTGFILGQILSPKYDNIAYKLILLSCLLTYALALMYSGSKSALIVLGLMLVLGGYISLRKVSLYYRGKILAIGLFFLFVLYYMLVNYYGDILDLFLARFNSSDTAYERIKSWLAGGELLLDNLILGVGVGNYAYMIGLHNPSIVETSRASHNMYMEALVEVGIFGLLSVLWIVVSPLIKYLRRGFHGLEVILPLLSLLFMGMTLSLLYEKYVWILIALLHNEYILSKNVRT